MRRVIIKLCLFMMVFGSLTLVGTLAALVIK
jgi:hypothetical protein